MTADKQSAAPPVEREKDFTCRIGHCAAPAACGFEGPCLAGLPPLPERRALPVIGSGIAGHARGYTADQMCEYARAALLASPPIPAGQEVRMLTDEEIIDNTRGETYVMPDEEKLALIAGRTAIACFLALNAGKTIPKLAPATTEPKP